MQYSGAMSGIDQDARDALTEAAGAGCDAETAHRLAMQAAHALGLEQAMKVAGIGAAQVQAVADSLAGVLLPMALTGPRDALETMLAAQMAAAHGAAMRALTRAAENAEFPHIEARYLREGARLMSLWLRQMQALDKRRNAVGVKAAACAEAAEFSLHFETQPAAAPQHEENQAKPHQHEDNKAKPHPEEARSAVSKGPAEESATAEKTNHRGTETQREAVNRARLRAARRASPASTPSPHPEPVEECVIERGRAACRYSQAHPSTSSG